MAKKTPLVVGVIGCGRIGKLHTQNLVQSIPGVTVKTVADPMIDGVTDWLKVLGVPNITKNADDIINDPEIDIVVICSSTDTHAKYSIAAAKAKKAIFCEKPIDSDLGRIKEVLAAVKENGVKFMVGFNRRFDHNFKRVRDATLKGDLGKVQIVKITSRDPSANVEYLKKSGGIFFDMCIHDIDMARFQAGDEVEEVYAMGDVQVYPEIKGIDIDTAVLNLKFKNGVMAVIDNCRQAVYGYDQRLEVFGSKGAAIANNDAVNTVQFYDKNTVYQDKIPFFFLERYMSSYQEEMNQFIDAIINDKEVPVTGSDGMMDVIVAMAATKSIKENRVVKLIEIK
jgi:myo-inositol 2-dehydrogenase/D-chiro-inositol 1-dehydrogenase